MVLRCDLCSIEVPDEHVLADHTNGKRHQALLTARERYETSQNSSIYVSRIKPEHDEYILKTYFQQFGPIKNCFVDKEKHVYAIIEYDHVDSTNKCLAYGEEYKLADGTRLKVKQRQHQEYRFKRLLVSEQEFLNIDKDKEIEQHATLLQVLNNQTTIDEQANAIVQQDKLADETVQIREKFFNELQTMFSKQFAGARLSLIGSMANGLATSLSDMDLVLILNDTYVEAQQPSSSNSSGDSMHVDDNSCSNDIDTNQNKFKRNASDESSNRSASPPSSCTADDLLQMSIPDRLDYIRRLLRSYAAYVCYVQRIARARCPVVRFCHKQQKFFCELSINNHLAVANTDLIRYFLAFEPKLSPLLYTIRLWIKQKDLLGKGHRFNTYTLFWMLVCSLQAHPQLLPSVQSLADRATQKRQHGPWNCSLPDIHSIEKNQSSSTIEQMLQHFFSFYSTLHASQFDLSPWTGRLEAKASLDIPFSISDPFEHDHNLTSTVSHANWLKFQEECSLANQILAEASKKRQNKSWGLSLILTRKSLPQKNFAHLQQQHHHHASPVTNTLALALDGLTKHELHEKAQRVLTDILLFEPVDPEMMRRKRSASHSTEVTPNSLAEQFDETLSAKRRRVDDDGHALTPVMDNEDVRTSEPSKEKTHFQIIHRTWQDRRKFKKSVESQDNHVSLAEREKLISDKLKEDHDHRIKTSFYVSMATKSVASIDDATSQKAQIQFELHTKEHQQLFVDLTHFLALYLPKMLQTPSAN